MESKTFQWFERGFPCLSTNPDLGNTELLIIGKQMEMIGNIPIKAKAVLWLLFAPDLLPGSIYIFFYQNLECLKCS